MFRAAIEIGSGTLRFCIAEMNDKVDGIKNIIHAEDKDIALASKAKENNNMLPDVSYSKLKKKLRQFQDLAVKKQCVEIQVVATDIFRKANNGSSFIEKLSKELGLKISIVDQDTEGVLHFKTVAYNIQDSLDQKNLVAWDSGSSSVQISKMNEKDEILVYKTALGMTSTHILFQEKIRNEEYLRKKSPNPVLKSEAESLILELKKQTSEIPSWLSKAISNGAVVVRTCSKQEHIRNVFSLSQNNEEITIESIRELLDQVCEKDDNQIGKIIKTEILGLRRRIVLRLCMLQAMMEQLSISSIRMPVLKSKGNTHGVLLQSEYWSNK